MGIQQDLNILVQNNKDLPSVSPVSQFNSEEERVSKVSNQLAKPFHPKPYKELDVVTPVIPVQSEQAATLDYTSGHCASCGQSLD